MEALDFILNYVGVVFGKVSLNYDFFHWCHGSFEFFILFSCPWGSCTTNVPVLDLNFVASSCRAYFELILQANEK